MARLFPLLVALLVVATVHAAPTLVPSNQYTEQQLAGWKVHVNRELLEKRAEVGTRALTLLESKLTEICKLLRPPALEALQRVPIWLGVDDYEKPNAVYHPNPQWLKDHGFNPDKARCVEIPNAAVFIEWSQTQPMIVLHELAHAYHHQVLGHGNAALREAFENARKSTRYEQVHYVRGGTKRAYALNNVEEFFAEMSEAFFGRNDFFPFTRDELRSYDPETCALIEQLWNRAEKP